MVRKPRLELILVWKKGHDKLEKVWRRVFGDRLEYRRLELRDGLRVPDKWGLEGNEGGTGMVICDGPGEGLDGARVERYTWCTRVDGVAECSEAEKVLGRQVRAEGSWRLGQRLRDRFQELARLGMRSRGGTSAYGVLPEGAEADVEETEGFLDSLRTYVESAAVEANWVLAAGNGSAGVGEGVRLAVSPAHGGALPEKVRDGALLESLLLSLSGGPVEGAVLSAGEVGQRNLSDEASDQVRGALGERGDAQILPVEKKRIDGGEEAAILERLDSLIRVFVSGALSLGHVNVPANASVSGDSNNIAKNGLPESWRLLLPEFGRCSRGT